MIKAVFIFAILATATLQQTSAEEKFNPYENDQDFQKLVKAYMAVAHIEESLGITSNEAAKMMATCVYDIAKFIPQLAAIVEAFQWQLVPPLIKSIISIYQNCQAFKYLQLNATCGNAVTQIGSLIRLSWDTFVKAANRTWLNNTSQQLLAYMRTVRDTCIKTSAGDYLLQTA